MLLFQKCVKSNLPKKITNFSISSPFSSLPVDSSRLSSSMAPQPTPVFPPTRLVLVPQHTCPNVDMALNNRSFLVPFIGHTCKQIIPFPIPLLVALGTPAGISTGTGGLAVCLTYYHVYLRIYKKVLTRSLKA